MPDWNTKEAPLKRQKVKYLRQELLSKAWFEEQGNTCRNTPVGKTPAGSCRKLTPGWKSHGWKIQMLWLGKRDRTQVIKILHGAEVLSRE